MAALDAALAAIRGYDGIPLKIMEVCGTHTAAILKSGIRTLLPPSISLVSGPGCPVCVTPAAAIDKLVGLSREPDTCVLCFGDMMRVPGGNGSLADAKANGGQIRIIYSPFEALTLAQNLPHTLFIMAAVGFETTAPLYALLLERIMAENIPNIKFVTAIKHIAPAVTMIMEGENEISALICPGHVGAIIGTEPFAELSRTYGKPFVITGFESAHIAAALYEILRQSASKQSKMVNLYPSAVPEKGNPKALELIERYFTLKDTAWRGLGNIPNSGYFLREQYAGFEIEYAQQDEPNDCACGEVLLGKIDPNQCPMFGTACTPANPVGPCMVSHEGACGLWFSSR